ncbi:MAG: response regulator transcription factor [Firmicutes bacterium]|nr:response regulator transcription factor [Bacillota bacterium]
MNVRKIRVMVVDDHEMVRRGICSYLETEDDLDVVGQAHSGKSALELALKLKPDVILMDLIMEDGTGIEATAAIKQELPDVQIIILTSFIDEKLVFPALEAGALSYLLKTAHAEEIVDTIRLAIRQEAVIEPKVATKMLARMRHTDEHQPHNDLTERELEILMLIGEGKTNQEIADELFIGIKTVKTHVSNVLNKLGVEDRTKAAVYAHRHKIV